MSGKVEYVVQIRSRAGKDEEWDDWMESPTVEEALANQGKLQARFWESRLRLRVTRVTYEPLRGGRKQSQSPAGAERGGT